MVVYLVVKQSKPHRKGIVFSAEHKRNLSEAAKRRYENGKRHIATSSGL